MHGKFAVLIFLFVVSTIFSPTIFGQANCEGNKIFTENICSGDEVNQPEKELFRIVNEYRVQNNLPPIALSESLSIIANRHLLDIIQNLKILTHGWSNCPYDLKNKDTWDCVFESPKRFKVNYKGKGFENLYRINGGQVTPSATLEAWKNSPLHNALILNLNSWKDTKFDAFGLAIDGQYAALWFGSSSGIKDGLKNLQTSGLGVTFERAVAGLTEVVSIKKASSTAVSEQWTGTSPDKSVLLEVAGTQEDVSQATISIKIRLESKTQISAKNRRILGVFLKNLASEWKERDEWTDAAIKNLQSNPKIPQTTIQGNKIITMGVEAQNYLSITVKPKPVAKEFK